MEKYNAAPPSNRFRNWIHTVPEGIRRQYGYNIWKKHLETKGDLDVWKNTLHEGESVRHSIQNTLDFVVQHGMDLLQQATAHGLTEEDIAYMGLWGSSYITPRKSESPDIDICIGLNKGFGGVYTSQGPFGLSPISTQVSTNEYSGKVDFFIIEPSQSHDFLLQPFMVFYKEGVSTDILLQKQTQHAIDDIIFDLIALGGRDAKLIEKHSIIKNGGCMEDIKSKIHQSVGAAMGYIESLRLG